MIERKCLACGTWNKDEDLCINCSNPISPSAIITAKEKKRKEEDDAKIPPSKLDIYLEKAKNSRFLIIRLGYYIMYSIVMFIGAIGVFLAWMAALANG